MNSERRGGNYAPVMSGEYLVVKEAVKAGVEIQLIGTFEYKLAGEKHTVELSGEGSDGKLINLGESLCIQVGNNKVILDLKDFDKLKLSTASQTRLADYQKNEKAAQERFNREYVPTITAPEKKDVRTPFELIKDWLRNYSFGVSIFDDKRSRGYSVNLLPPPRALDEIMRNLSTKIPFHNGAMKMSSQGGAEGNIVVDFSSQDLQEEMTDFIHNKFAGSIAVGKQKLAHNKVEKMVFNKKISQVEIQIYPN